MAKPMHATQRCRTTARSTPTATAPCSRSTREADRAVRMCAACGDDCETEENILAFGPRDRQIWLHMRCVPYMRFCDGPAGDSLGWPGGLRPDNAGDGWGFDGCVVCGGAVADADSFIASMNHIADMDLPMHIRLHRRCVPSVAGEC